MHTEQLLEKYDCVEKLMYLYKKQRKNISTSSTTFGWIASIEEK